MSKLREMLKKINPQTIKGDLSFQFVGISKATPQKKRMLLLSLSILIASAVLMTQHWRQRRVQDLKKSAMQVPNQQNPLDLKEVTGLLQSGQPEEAIKKIRELLTVHKDPHLLINLGLAHKHMGKLLEAEVQYKKALELAPDSAVAHNNLGMVKMELKDFKGAEAALKKAQALDQNYPDPNFNLAVLYEKKKIWNKALDHYKAYLSASSPNLENAKLLKDRIRHLSALSAFAQYKEGIR